MTGEVDGVGFDIFAMKEPDYIMMLMSSYGQLIVKKGQREDIMYVEDPAIGESNVDKFRYTEVISKHFQFCGAVYYTNQKRMYVHGSHGMSLEITCRTIIW